MQTQRILGMCLVVSLLLLGAAVYAQVERPTHDGTVWALSLFIVHRESTRSTGR